MNPRPFSRHGFVGGGWCPSNLVLMTECHRVSVRLPNGKDSFFSKSV